MDKNKRINVIEKKFQLFVINQSLHWSLTVIVNPGFIEQHHKFVEDGFKEEKGFDRLAEMLLMLFFDSMITNCY
jgi:DNA-binding ferritin-like protein